MRWGRFLGKSKLRATVAVLLLLLLVAVSRWWVASTTPASPPTTGDLMTPTSIAQLAALRRALKDNNKEFYKLKEGIDEFVMNGRVDRLESITKTEFNDYVVSSRPFVLADPSVNCTQHKWTIEYIAEVAGDDVVGVETSKSNRFYSNEQLQKVRMSVREFLSEFRSPTRRVDYYLAEENMVQFPALNNDYRLPEFCEDYNLDRAQLWIGAGGQVSPMHQDQWENVLCQIQGTRKLTIYDPLQVDRLYPKGGVNRHFSQVNPEEPDFVKFPRFKEAVGYTVQLNAGELLYLPAHWWHQVHHKDAVNVAVNFWFTPFILGELLLDTLLPEGPNY